MKKVLKLILLLTIFLWSEQGYTAELKNGAELKKCTTCHGKPGFSKVLENGKILDLYIDEKILRNSVHGKKECTDCHVDITEIPHRGEIKAVNCSKQCHFIGNTSGAPQTDKYIEYKNSVHGKEFFAGNKKAPVCQDCHGTHNIFKPSNGLSQVSRHNLPRTCAKCHLNIYIEYKESIHGVMFEKGNKDVPVCTNCHGEHNIRRPEDPLSTVSKGNTAFACSKCHSKVEIMKKYGIETEQVETFKESFHGVASEFGSKTVANCASCHGVHDIRPSTDPKSSINKANIPKTCGKCHPGANINFAKGKIHVNPKVKEAGIIYYVSQGFKWLTILTMVGLVTHIFLDLYRRKTRSKETE
ncbi:MAG: hypothetical protein A2149_05370 [Candidatus Schekmanbacteria bacterium RBG_16_38_11]|uniref:Uncharacterized protein n=1 Tax=Candidatus Schekmanbacteria bacterium RBG_16_38_11 TaxID=1817880 RepID=A0A1F7RZ41_9BACT|nr:MAG: hypothetical protein A2149_05370 [Candidatus Schekmanbacteria bacterium RBG_16_38_11]